MGTAEERSRSVAGWFVIFAVVAAVGLVAFVGGAAAVPTDVTGCDVLDAPGAYVLTGDIDGSGEDVCLEIASSDVVLDGGGHAVTGDKGYRSKGVLVNGSADGRLANVTVRNLTVDGWFAGVHVEHVDGLAVADVSATDNDDWGLELRWVNGAVLENVTTADNSIADGGVHVVDSSSVDVVRPSSIDDGVGVDVSGSHDVTIRGGTFTYSNEGSRAAVTIKDSGGVVVDDGVVVDGSIAGISGTAGTPNRVTNNSASRTSRYGGWTQECGGISVNGAADDLVANNSMVDCSSGTSIQNSERIEFRNNTITGTNGDGGNSDWGLRVSDGSGHVIVDNHIAYNGLAYNRKAGLILGTSRAYLSGNTFEGNGFNVQIGGSNVGDLSHTIDATNTVEGRPIAYHVNETDVTVDPNAGWVGLVGTRNAVVADVTFPENNYENVFLFAADDTVVRNVTSTTGWLGMRIDGDSDRTRVEDSLFDGGHGLSLSRSADTELVDVTVSASKNHGIVLYESPGTALENVTLAGNDKYGVYVQSGSERVTVANSTVENNGWAGLSLDRAHRSVVVDSVVRDNDGPGITAGRYFHNATIVGNTIAGNSGDGVSVSSDAAHNAIDGNLIADNGANGVELGQNGHGDRVTGNVLVGNAVGLDVPRSYDDLTVHDNYFNNTANVVFADPAGATNATWNGSAAAVENVVGGATTGGNYWAAPDGTGFSETCTDRGDGICGSGYELASGHVDHLPLTLGDGPDDGDDGPTVTVQSVTVVGGSDPGTTPYVEAYVDEQPMLQLGLRTSEFGGYDLADAGFDGTTEFEIQLTVEGFAPRLLLGAGDVVSWERSDAAPNVTDVTLRVRPIEVQAIFKCTDGGQTCTTPDLADWPEGEDDRATEADDATVSLAMSDLAGYPADQRAALEGAVVATDAQLFGDPVYRPGTEPGAGNLSLLVGGPHLTVDGDVNDGFYDALLPAALVDAWGVDDPETELAAAYQGNPAAFTVAETDDGDVRISVDVHYSAGTVVVGTAPDTDGGEATPTPTPTTTPTSTSTPISTATPTPTPTSTSTPTPTTATIPTATPTATPTPTATQPTTADGGTATPVESTAGDAEDQDGFGAAVGMFALLAGTALAWRRRQA